MWSVRPALALDGEPDAIATPTDDGQFPRTEPQQEVFR